MSYPRVCRSLVIASILPFGVALGGSIDAAAVLGPGVRETVAREGTARVLVFLDVPGVEALSLPAARLEIAKAQDRALAALGPDGFVVARRFEAVPGLAGHLSIAGLARVASAAGVVRVDLDEGGTGGLAQSVPLVHADQVQSLGFTGLGVTAAILDSGIDTDHPDLADDLDGEACFCSTGCCPGGGTTRFGPGAAEDDHGHGSNVTGIVTSGGIVSAPGVAPDAKIVAIKVLDGNNSFCCTSDVVAGLDWIVNNRPDVDVVNMSLGTFALYAGECDAANSSTMAFASVINTLRNRGTLSFVSSMNNASGTSMGAPACVASAISVGAVYDANLGSTSYGVCSDGTTAPNKVTCFSNSNSTTDLFAPGAAVTSDYLGGGLSTFHGTSQASPHAAACTADILEAKPSATPAEIEAALESTGLAVTDAKNGLSFPRIDCLAALHRVWCASAADCDDGVFCNGEESCVDQSCGGGTPPGCSDGNPCTTDSCGSTITVFRDDLESGGPGWTHLAQNDSWHLASSSCFSDPLPSTMFVSNGNAGMGCVLNSRLERSRLLSPAIALPASGPLTLTFDALSFDQAGRCTTASDLDEHDVRITTDDGMTFTLLNACTALADGSGSVIHHSFDVSSFAGQTVKVFFFYDTVNAMTGHTFAIDNVTITGVLDACHNAANPDGSSCDDGDPATCADACSSGSCAGTSLPPSEVNDTIAVARDAGGAVVSWTDPPGPFNVYRGFVPSGGSFLPYAHACFDPLTSGPTTDGENPAAGGLFYYLVTRVDPCGESIPGRDSTGAPIPNANPCP